MTTTTTELPVRNINKLSVQLDNKSVIGETTINSTRLVSYKQHLKETGKVCPKPWYWSRFYSQFRPMYESYWLMQWWNTSVDEKHERFITQLDYLAYHTMRFQSAYWFLTMLKEKNWLYRGDDSL